MFAPLRTSVRVRLNIQFLRDNEPTASLAAKAFVILKAAMPLGLLLGRDRWMRFAQRTYTTLLNQRPLHATHPIPPRLNKTFGLRTRPSGVPYRLRCPLC